MVTVVMSCGKSFTVDAEDWNAVKTVEFVNGHKLTIVPSHFRWTLSAHSKRSAGYAMNRIDRPGGRRFSVYLHRLVTQCPVGMFVNHIDGNTLNNCRENLEIVTPRQNSIWRRGRTDLLASLGFTRAGEIPEDFACNGMFARSRV